MPVARFELPDGRVARFEVTEGTTPEQAQVLMQQQLSQLEATASENESNDPFDFSLLETVKNIPGSAVQLGKDIIQPVIHPIETAKSLQTVGQGLVEKMIPDTINGHDFGETENEQAVDAVGQFIVDRYGSIDNFKKTVQEDPVGVLADASILFTGGGTAALKTGKAAKVAETVQTVGKAIDPLNVTVSAAKTFIKAGKAIPESVPQKLLESALKFRPSIPQAQRLKMTKTALREGIMPTVDGLKKITENLAFLDERLNRIIDLATEQGKTIPASRMFTELKNLRQNLGGAKLNAASDLKAIDNLVRDFATNLKELNKSKLTPREVQNLKTDAYKRINFDLQQGNANFAKNETRAAVARAAKQSLEELDSDVKITNQRMGSLIELQNELERVVARLDNRNLISLDTAAKIGAGSATNAPVGTVAGATASFFGAPRVKAKTALALENLRKNTETIEIINNKLDPVLARALLLQAERINETLSAEIENEED